MAGLGLMDAVDAYQQGVSWQQGQQEIARVQKQRAAIDAANQAAAAVFDAGKAEWAANGAQGDYRPNDATMFKAAEARGTALARAGMWDQFMQNEAQVAPMRLRARSNALQRYQTDGDIEALARSVYPTIFDGKEITGIEKIEGAPGSTNLGLAARPSSMRIKLSDGSVQAMDPQQLVTIVKSSLIDPQVTLKNEIELNMARAKAQAEADAKISVERVRGEEERKTEGVKGANAGKLAAVKFGYDLQLHTADNASRERVGAGNNAATLGAARIHADGQIKAAGSKDGGTKKDALYDQFHDEFVRVFGDTRIGALGGTKTANEQTAVMAQAAAALKKANPDMPVGEVIKTVSAEWKKRHPEWKPSGLGLGG